MSQGMVRCDQLSGKVLVTVSDLSRGASGVCHVLKYICPSFALFNIQIVLPNAFVWLSGSIM